MTAVRHVVLLRGINVGGHNKLPMAELRAALTTAGYEDVETYIQSGNVAVTGTPDDCTPERIGAVIADGFGYDLPIVTRTADELAAVIAGNPFPETETEPKRLLVFFCDAAPSPDAVAAFDHEAHLPDRFEARGAELYVSYHEAMSASKLGNDVLERALGVTTTARNWRTVLKLADMAGPATER